MLRNMLVCLFRWTFEKCRLVLEIFNFLIAGFLYDLKMFKCGSKKSANRYKKPLVLRTLTWMER